MLHRLVLAASIALASVSANATSYIVDPTHTGGVLRWNHRGYSNPTAQFSQVEGSLEFDQADPSKSSVTATIPIAKLDSGVPELNDRLRDIEFFDLANFPTATFRSTKVEKGGTPGQLKVTGDLSVRGATRPVTLDVTINKVDASASAGDLLEIGFDATATIKRSDFGLGLYAPVIVSDEIRIAISGEAIEAKAYVENLKADAARAATKAAAAKAAAEKAAAAERAQKKSR
jgi:polyisoprenoid-binding protein YceI